MNLSRRAVLKGATAIVATVPASAALGSTPASKSLFLVLQGLEVLSTSTISRLLDVFIGRGIPFGIQIQDIAKRDVRSPDKDSILEVIGQAAVREPGLIELIPTYVPTAESERYFQLRSASEFRRQLAESLLGEVMGEKIAQVVTVIADGNADTTNIYAYRAAGFRIHIKSTKGDPVTRQTTNATHPLDWGILSITETANAKFEDNPSPMLEQLRSNTGDQLLSLSFEDAGRVRADIVLEKCMDWADAIHTAISKGELFVTRPSDYLIQGNPGVSKYLALVLDMRAGENAGMRAIATDLDTIGLPYTILASDGDKSGEDKNVCVELNTTDIEAFPTCVLTGPSTPKQILDAAEIQLVPPEAGIYWTGQRSDARFQISLSKRQDTSVLAKHLADPMSDKVELIAPSQVVTEIQRRALLRDLLQLHRDGNAHFFTLPGFMNEIVAPEPELERLWSTRKRSLRGPQSETGLGPSDDEQLQTDAQAAWHFIATYTDDMTGICAGTATANVTNHNVTMWDVGSQLFGIISAWRIGLIKQAEATNRVDLILRHLPTIEIDGAKLPPAVFGSNSLAIAQRGFNACDAGRLLNALAATASSGLANAADIEALVSSWDLSQTIREGRVFSNTNGRWIDATMSHCAPYTKRGYLAWGMNIETPFPDLDTFSNGDDQMRVLHQAAFLGQFGPEPILLEALEGEQSSTSRFLADVLFDAQLSWYEQTGEMKCVSESPLNFEPWFVFQGLRVDFRQGDAWSLNTPDNHSRYKSAAFKRRVDLISSKSAYMWAATHPHPYSDKLVRLVRRKARILDHGFSVGVFSQSLEPMDDYSDLNTNGIILSAIATILETR